VTGRQTRQRGFTIVEALLSIAILSIVTLVMASTFLIGYRTVSNEARVIAADTAVSGASLWLTRDIQTAAAVPVGTISSASTVTLAYGSPAITVVYSVDATRNLIRTVNGTGQVAARGITSVVITAAGCYTTVTIQPSATGAVARILNVGNRQGGCL
jgi:prepilin-type N-terminal cleavage/methylation domain-containing protein